MDEVILRRRPTNRNLNNHLTPNVLRVVIHNNHVNKVNHDINKFSHIDVKKEADDIRALYVSNKYNIMTYDDNNDDKINIIHIDNLDQVMKYIKENHDTDTHARFILNISKCDMNYLLYEMVNTHKVTPNIKMVSRKIILISFTIENKKYIIVPNTDTNNTENENEHEITQDEYNEYLKQEQILYKNIIHDKLISEYPPDVLRVDNTYKRATHLV